MKGISRRTRACAAVALASVAVLGLSSAAQAQTEGRQRTGDGIPTGQMGTQMFNYGGYLSNGGTAATTSAITGVSTGCQNGNTPSQAVCARERLEGLFRMFQRRGTTNIELFNHTGFPPTTIQTTLNQAAAVGATAVRLNSTNNLLVGDSLTVDTGAAQETITIASFVTPAPAAPAPNITLAAPLTKAHASGAAVSYGFNKRGLEDYRALMDKYGIQAGGQHGDVSEANWANTVAAGKILGADQLGSGGTPAPGIGTSGTAAGYASLLQTIETANKLGKYSVENGVGRIYIHNHQQEFRTRYVENGVLKTAWQIYMERIDARYAAAEIDVAWASDAYDDVTGTQVAALINQFPTKVKLLHIKDAANIKPATLTPAGNTDPLACNPCSNASARATGFAVPADRTEFDGLNFTPIFAAAAGRVQYYHHEHDGGNPNNANDSFTNLRGINARAVGTVLGKPTSFPSVPAGTPAANNVVPVVLQNTGDAPLTITGLSITADALDVGAASDFSVVSNNCTGAPLAPSTLVADDPATPADETAYATPRGTCTAMVGYTPRRSGHLSVARLQIASGSDAATESVLLTGQSTNSALGTVGGTVDSLLSLSISSTPSFGTFVPAVARTYDAAAAATVVATTGDAALSVSDTSAVFPGRLLNGTFALASPVTVRAANAAQPNPAYSPVTGSPTTLLNYANPTAGADPVTLGFRQAIGATDALRAGGYSKTLTFTLSTTTP